MRDNGYPCWLYSAKGPRLVKDEAEHEAMDGDWYESPADIPPEAMADAERDALAGRAQELGVEVDKRWGSKRLAAEIAKAEAAKAA